MACSSRRGRWGRGFLSALLGAEMVIAVAALPAAAEGAGELPATVGRIALIDGQASFREAAQDPWTAGLANTPVIAGASLWTQPSSRAALEIAAGRFWLDGGTETDVIRLDDHRVILALPQGRIDVTLGGLRPGDSYVVATPSGSVALEAAGFYRVSAGDQDTPPSVAVFAGRADFSSGGGTQTVEGGQEAFAPGAGSPFGAAEEDPFDRWVDAQDGQDDGRVSSQYVPPGIPGTDDLDAYGQWREVPDYGTVWVPTKVPSDWQPYRDGRWQWIDPWGWTWVDNAPWGFAPFHYGRWVNLDGWWTWVPGRREIRPVYAPALVTFIGDPGGDVDGGGPSVGWVPLGPREVYRPSWVGLGGGIGLALTFDHFRRMNPDIRADQLARFNDHGRFHDRADDRDHGDRFINRNYVTIVNRDTFVNARPVRDGLRRMHPGAEIHGTYNPAQAGLPAAPTRESHGDWHGVGAPPQPRYPASGGIFPGGGIGNVGRPPAPVQVFRGGVGSLEPVGVSPAPIRALPQGEQPRRTPFLSGQQGQQQNYGGVGAAPAGIRPVAPLGGAPHLIRPVAPIAPLRPVVVQPSYRPQQFQPQAPSPIRQPQFQQQAPSPIRQPQFLQQAPPPIRQPQFEQHAPPPIRQPQFQQAAPVFHPAPPRAVAPLGQPGGQRRPQ